LFEIDEEVSEAGDGTVFVLSRQPLDVCGISVRLSSVEGLTMDRVLKITQAYSLTPWRRQLQIIGLFLVVLVVFALIAGVYLSVNARATNIGRQIQNYHRDIEKLEFLIADQQSQLAILTSASEMEKRAQTLGFRPATTEEILYIQVDGYNGRTAAVLASDSVSYVPASPAVVSPAFTQSLLDWVAQELSLAPFVFERSQP
jgi:cell division protein FtsL